MKRKHKLKRSIVRIIFSFLILSLMFGSILTVLGRVISLNKEKKALENTLVSTKTKKENLEDEMNKLNDEDYVARYAREKYLFSKEGEYIIKIQK